MSRHVRVVALVAALGIAMARGAVAGPTSPQLEVEGKGVITAVSGACPDARVLTILGIPVTVNSSTVLPAGQSCLSLAVDQQVEVKGLLSITNGALSVVAITIEIEDEASEVEGEGRVTALEGTCPELTLTVDGITVKTDALTKFVPPGLGANCTAIQVGTKIKAKAVPAVAPATGYRARLVQIRGHRHFMEGEGRITSVEGSCPTKTVFFGELEVRVNEATLYRSGGSCDALQPGVKAWGKAFQDDGTGPIIATVMHVKARRVEGRSVVQSKTGMCPDLALVVGGYKVATNGSTAFEKGTCASIDVGTTVKVKGDMLSEDGSIMAEKIEIEGGRRGSRSGPHRGGGVITSASGTCSAKSLVVAGYQVTTDTSTRIEDGTCADLVVGRRIEVEAYVEGSKILAAKIEVK